MYPYRVVSERVSGLNVIESYHSNFNNAARAATAATNCDHEMRRYSITTLIIYRIEELIDGKWIDMEWRIGD